MTKKQRQHSFYETLKVLYYFIDEESKSDTGKILDKMNETKKIITQLAEDLGNLALLDNWYEAELIPKNALKELVSYDDQTGIYKFKEDLTKNKNYKKRKKGSIPGRKICL
jgi:hypothetical protein